MKSGNLRYLVRVKGQPSKRITLSVSPEHPDFHEHYTAARQGLKVTAQTTLTTAAARGSVAWLAYAYLDHLERLVQAGTASPLTLKQRRSLVGELVKQKSTAPRSRGFSYAELPMEIPQDELARMLDALAATPGKAKNMLKMLRAMYKWAIQQGHCQVNPAQGVNVAYQSKGGATPWTLADLEKFRKAHPAGTAAYLRLTLFMFTACRISDAVRLGPANEFRLNGQLWLGWDPVKRGSPRVEIPVLLPLERALSSRKVVHPNTYLLTDHGKPFSSPESLRNRLKKDCGLAGIEERSAHGIRKAAGHLLSLFGATQYEIMAILGHEQASTSEVYTKGVERQKLAASGASKLAGLDW